MQSLENCQNAAEAINIIVKDSNEYLNAKCHCKTSLLYKQRIFQKYLDMAEEFNDFNPEVKESYLLSWAYILREIPKTLLINNANKVFYINFSFFFLATIELC